MGWSSPGSWGGGAGWRQEARLPLGFALNGATSPKLKAAVARVKAGSGRARMVMKGDSTTVGQGAGTTTDSYGLTGARPNRIAKVLADLLTASGTTALGGSIVSDNGMWVAGGFSTQSYDPRVGTPTSWGVAHDQTFAGGGYFTSGSSAPLKFTPDVPVDTFEVVYYNPSAQTVTLAIDGAVPASGPSTFTSTNAGGFGKVTVKAASVGTHYLTLAGNNGNAVVRSITAYDGTKAGLDILVHASLGATSTHQASTGGNSWLNQEALGFDAPDVTRINLGLNDMNAGVTTSTFTANLQAIITKAKISGDVLLIFPTPASGGYNANVDAFNTAAKNLAVSNAIPFLSLYEFYGPFTSAFGTRLFDGAVHPKADLYAEIAGTIKRCIDAMVAA